MASRRAKKCLDLLHNADGSWKPLEIRGPTGRTVKRFASADKSDKQLAVEQASKKLSKAIANLHKDRSVHCLKRQGVVTMDWKRLAKVDVNSYREVQIQWNTLVITEYNIDKAAVRTAFDALWDTRSTIAEWAP